MFCSVCVGWSSSVGTFWERHRCKTFRLSRDTRRANLLSLSVVLHISLHPKHCLIKLLRDGLFLDINCLKELFNVYSLLLSNFETIKIFTINKCTNYTRKYSTRLKTSTTFVSILKIAQRTLTSIFRVKKKLTQIYFETGF